MDTGVSLHGSYYIIGLIGQGFQSGTNQMSAIKPTGKAYNGTSCTLVPVGSAKSGKGRHNISACGIRNPLSILGTLCRSRNHTQLVPKPLDCGSRDEYGTFQSVFHVVFESDCNAGYKTVSAFNDFSSGIHQEEASGSIGVLHAARFKTALPEQGTLLVSCCACNGDLTAV